SPLERHCTPWKTDGMKPLPQQLWPPLGCTPLEISTTNPGRFSFSEPRPYVTHDPIDGRPARGEPVNSSSSAGAWLNWSVYIDLITQMSSATSCSRGTASDIQMPPWPCCANVRGVPSRLGVPDVKANRLPLMNSSGAGFPVCFTSSGL